MTQSGLLQVYTGPGKGKTTAALGLAVRALGCEQKVLLVRMLKSARFESGEVRLLSRLPGIAIIEAGVGVIREKPSAAALRDSILAALEKARLFWLGHQVDLLILDEINNALHRGILSMDELMTFLQERPAGLEVVLTGRNAPDELLQRADLVTWMENRCHPFERGIPARAGIDY